MDGSYITMRVFANWPSWIGLRWSFLLPGYKVTTKPPFGEYLIFFQASYANPSHPMVSMGSKWMKTTSWQGRVLLGHYFRSDSRSHQHCWNSDIYQLLPHSWTSWTCRQVRHIAQKMSSTNAHPHIDQRVAVFFGTCGQNCRCSFLLHNTAAIATRFAPCLRKRHYRMEAISLKYISGTSGF